MSRPLIIKVDSHKSRPNKKATGSIAVQLLKGTSKGSMHETYHSETDNASSVAEVEVNPPEESGSSSIVRSLISRYETSTDKTKLTKSKSKSMVDLQKPQSATKKTQDDFLYNRGKYNDEESEKNFNFKKVFLKFETSSLSEKPKSATSRSGPPAKNYKPPIYKNDSLDFGSIQQKARLLLEKRERDREYPSWQDQVVELLEQIKQLDGLANPVEVKPSHAKKVEEKTPPSTYRQENTLQRAKSLDHGEFSNGLKVKDITDIYETKIGETKPLSRSVSTYATYFGLKTTDEEGSQFNNLINTHRGLTATPFNNDSSNNQTETRRSESGDSSEEDSFDVEFANREITSDVIEGNRIITQPVLAPAMKIQGLRNLFVTEPDKYVPSESYVQKENDNPEETDIFASDTPDIHIVENRMLPPPKILEMDGYVNVEQSKQRIEDLTSDVEEYEQQIGNLPEGNELEGSYINEALIRVLLKLDDVKTYGDALIAAERKKAIQFVQSCIGKLREKLKGREENS